MTAQLKWVRCMLEVLHIVQDEDPEACSQQIATTSDSYLEISQYLHACIEEIRLIFSENTEKYLNNSICEPNEILKAILSHEFNYQSRGRVAHLTPALLAAFEQTIAARKKLPIYLLLHGGYRAMVGGDRHAHVFAPDITELLLIYQIARLERKIRAIYPPGISFSIVINNGVAAYTNGIRYENTNAYVRRLRDLIARLGAEQSIWVLNQSELGCFEDRMCGIDIPPKPAIDAVEHAIVERFLGRSCSIEEASQRAAMYVQAETVWGQEIRAIVAAQSGIFCRQIAHPDCLSFRSFPGGAIRVQNGTVGFRMGPKGPVPRFVTPITLNRMETSVFRIDLPLFEGIGPQFEDQHPIQVALP